MASPPDPGDNWRFLSKSEQRARKRFEDAQARRDAFIKRERYGEPQIEAAIDHSKSMPFSVARLMMTYLEPEDAVAFLSTSRQMRSETTDYDKRKLLFRYMDAHEGVSPWAVFMAPGWDNYADAREYVRAIGMEKVQEWVMEYFYIHCADAVFNRPFEVFPFDQICGWLEKNPNLKFLSFEGDILLMDEEINRLARALPKMHRLEVLRLDATWTTQAMMDEEFDLPPGLMIAPTNLDKLIIAKSYDDPPFWDNGQWQGPLPGLFHDLIIRNYGVNEVTYIEGERVQIGTTTAQLAAALRKNDSLTLIELLLPEFTDADVLLFYRAMTPDPPYVPVFDENGKPKRQPPPNPYNKTLLYLRTPRAHMNDRAAPIDDHLEMRREQIQRRNVAE